VASSSTPPPPPCLSHDRAIPPYTHITLSLDSQPASALTPSAGAALWLVYITTSSNHQNAGPYYKSGNNEGVPEHFMLVASSLAVDLKVFNIHVEFDQDAMEVDATKSCRLKLIVGNIVPSTSKTSMKLACSGISFYYCPWNQMEKCH
jgi:hypothetical protein